MECLQPTNSCQKSSVHETFTLEFSQNDKYENIVGRLGETLVTNSYRNVMACDCRAHMNYYFTHPPPNLQKPLHFTYSLCSLKIQVQSWMYSISSAQ